MPVETPITFIHTLNSANPLDTDFASDGDNHIRNIKAAVKATFPNINAAVTPTPAELNRVAGVTAPIQTQLNTHTTDIATINASNMPAGGIIMWSGAVVAIPAGWLLCNGGGGTPDLRGRFLVGAGGAYAVGNTGGQESITSVPAHTHGNGTLTVDLGGAHTHGVTDPGHFHAILDNAVDTSGTNNLGAGGSAFRGSETLVDYTSSNFSDITINSGGDHTHTVSGAIASAGAASVDVRPPYYALCYIMKT